MPSSADSGESIYSFQASGSVKGHRRSAGGRAQILAPQPNLCRAWPGVGPGSRVLDVGAKTGEQALLAAERVGPVGWRTALRGSAAADRAVQRWDCARAASAGSGAPLRRRHRLRQSSSQSSATGMARHDLTRRGTRS
jgi:hypothetical protein